MHAATNKDKLLLVLYSSKTHGLHHRPQKIKITSKRGEKTGSYMHRNFCPFHVLRVYMNLRGSYCSKDEHFFVFRDKQPVKPQQATVVLRTAIKTIGLDQTLYSMHSFRIGRSSDLIKFGYSLEEVKRLG